MISHNSNISRIIIFLLFPIGLLAQTILGTDTNSSKFERALNISQATDQEVDSILLLTTNYVDINIDTSLLLGKKALELTRHDTSSHTIEQFSSPFE